MTVDGKREFLWILIVSLLILLGSSIPTWAGYQAETKQFSFQGIFYDSQDYAVHIAMMKSGNHGEWAYQFRFTTEPHPPAYIRLFYIVLGHFSNWLNIGTETTYHLARWFWGFLALFALYRLMQHIFPDLLWARMGFLLAALGSGVGWLQLIFGWTSGPITPIDFWLIDGYIFFSLAVFPHFAFVTAGMCLVLQLWLDFLAKPDWKPIAGIGLAAILVQAVNPIALATVDVGLLGAALFSWWKAKQIRSKDIYTLVIIAAVQGPLFAYNFLVLNNYPAWNQFTIQNQTLSPPPDYYFWGFAFFWLLTIPGVILVLRERPTAGGAALFWVISSFLLAYAPVNIQRRFLQNITIPLGILATMALIYMFHGLGNYSPVVKRWQPSLLILFVFLISISSLQIGVGQMAYLQTHPEDLFYSASLDPALDWLRRNAQYNDFVLASEKTSQLLAQKAGLRTFLGHEMETLDYKNKLLKVEGFFQGKRPELADSPIQWVVYGPLEKTLGATFQAADNLKLVYDFQEVQIYKVK